MTQTISTVMVVGVISGCNTKRTPAPVQTVRTSESEKVGADIRQTLVPTGQVIASAGNVVTFFGRPTDLALSPRADLVAVQSSHSLVLIDSELGSIRQELPLRDADSRSPDQLGGGGFHGVAWDSSGDRLWTTDAKSSLREAARGPGGRFAWTRVLRLPGPSQTDVSAPGGVALVPKMSQLVVALSRNNAVAIVDLARWRIVRVIAVGAAPYGVYISGSGAYVTNWGGRIATSQELSGPSSGTRIPVDARTGVASTGSVSVVDLSANRVVGDIAVDLHPSGAALSPSGNELFVANANSDTVSVIDMVRRERVATIGVRPRDGLPFGSAPNAVIVSPDGRTLYVANGGNNLVVVIDIPTRSVRGMIPVGWYPSALALAPNGRLFVANLKGVGSRNRDADPSFRPRRKSGYNSLDYRGSVSIVRVGDDAALAAYSAQAGTTLGSPTASDAGRQRPERARVVPVPVRSGEQSVFKHVLYIIKENRTYDQFLGDMSKGNGDPRLCLFGNNVTPNHHALADEFVLFDNLYCNGVLSADGHQWTDEGYATDYVEKSMGGFPRSYPSDGTDALAYASSGFIWDAILTKGLTFRDYGEFLTANLKPVPSTATWSNFYSDYKNNTRTIGFVQQTDLHTLRPYISPAYPGFALDIPDVYRARAFIRELRDFERSDTLPSFMIMLLGNDHTSGIDEGFPTPRAAIADNDLALGEIVEAISHSKFWQDTVVFVVEDDPQDGLDHVDGHRTFAFAVSAYTRRQYLDHHFYNQNSILRTIEAIFGIPPLTQMDTIASPIVEPFQDTPDLTPYVAKPSRVPLDEMNPKATALTGLHRRLAVAATHMQLNRPDAVDDELMNRMLWHSAKGFDVPYPRLAQSQRDHRE